ncbi:MAG: carboxylesterase [Alcaligenaceae bacterium]|jgi:phospholipase/carboxylesterase|nr:carboxylesterase [Alcaligenaceae bacterium]
MSQELLNCVELIHPRKDDTVTHSVIWMHGLGANAHDFVPVPPYFRLPEALNIRFVFPNAPAMPVTINNGYIMPAWYDLLTMDIGGIREDEMGIRKSITDINALIEREIERGIPAENIFLAGFSQGSAMALSTGLRYPQKLGGIIGLSGYLPIADQTADERSPANQNTPILMVHGSLDPVVQMSRGEQSRDRLREWGYEVEWHDYPMQHEVCAEEIRDINDFLSKHAK